MPWPPTEKEDVMSSVYLTSENMSMIERVLESVRVKPMLAYADTSDAHFLIAAFQQGMSKESDLRTAFDEYREAQRSGGDGPFWSQALKIFKVFHRRRLDAVPIAASASPSAPSHATHGGTRNDAEVPHRRDGQHASHSVASRLNREHRR